MIRVQHIRKIVHRKLKHAKLNGRAFNSLERKNENRKNVCVKLNGELFAMNIVNIYMWIHDCRLTAYDLSNNN